MLRRIIGLAETNTGRLDWNEYFMSIAYLASMRSPCERLLHRASIVRDNRLISVGYNGFIAGAPHKSRVRDGHEQAIIHSEVNAIVDCARRGVSLDGAKIYVTHYPCINCFRSIAGSGIKEIIHSQDYRNDQLVAEIAEEAKIKIWQLVTN
jgi:dCMP deaminase